MIRQNKDLKNLQGGKMGRMCMALFGMILAMFMPFLLSARGIKRKAADVFRVMKIRKAGYILWGFFAVLFMPAMAFAQAVAPPTYLNSILAWISANSGSVAVFAGVVEVILRLIPSLKPMSLLVPVKYLVDGLSAICGFISGFLGVLISSLQAPAPPAAPPAG